MFLKIRCLYNEYSPYISMYYVLRPHKSSLLPGLKNSLKIQTKTNNKTTRCASSSCLMALFRVLKTFLNTLITTYKGNDLNFCLFNILSLLVVVARKTTIKFGFHAKFAIKSFSTQNIFKMESVSPTAAIIRVLTREKYKNCMQQS